jgi:hypothetical protein
MAEIVNLRRARKAKKRSEAEKEADANRVKHGVGGHVRKLEKAQETKTERDLAGKKLDPDRSR